MLKMKVRSPSGLVERSRQLYDVYLVVSGIFLPGLFQFWWSVVLIRSLHKGNWQHLRGGWKDPGLMFDYVDLKRQLSSHLLTILLRWLQCTYAAFDGRRGSQESPWRDFGPPLTFEFEKNYLLEVEDAEITKLLTQWWEYLGQKCKIGWNRIKLWWIKTDVFTDRY